MAIDPQQLAQMQMQIQQHNQQMQQQEQQLTPEDLIINLIAETAQNQSLDKGLQANIIHTLSNSLATIISIQLETAKLEHQFALDDFNVQHQQQTQQNQIQQQQNQLGIEQQKINSANKKATLDNMVKLAQHQDNLKQATIPQEP